MIRPNYLDIPPRVISPLNVGINSIPYRPWCCLPHPLLVPRVPVPGLRGVPPSGPPLPPHPHRPLSQALCTDPAVGPATSYLLPGLLLSPLWCLKNSLLLPHLLCEASPGFFLSLCALKSVPGARFLGSSTPSVPRQLCNPECVT